MRRKGLKRRQFCGDACKAVSFATLGSLVQGCGGTPTSPSARSVPFLPSVNATVSNGVVTMTIDAASPLSAVGSAALVQSSLGKLLVVHTAQSTFTALAAICTHEACTILGFDGSTFVCPCHGSEFNRSGRVLKGPASASLRQSTTQFTNNVLTIS